MPLHGRGEKKDGQIVVRGEQGAPGLQSTKASRDAEFTLFLRPPLRGTRAGDAARACGSKNGGELCARGVTAGTSTFCRRLPTLGVNLEALAGCWALAAAGRRRQQRVAAKGAQARGAVASAVLAASHVGCSRPGSAGGRAAVPAVAGGAARARPAAAPAARRHALASPAAALQQRGGGVRTYSGAVCSHSHCGHTCDAACA
jgi:hypothetical protein